MRHWTEETNWQPLSAVVSRLKRQVEEAYHYCREQEADEAHDDLVRAEWRLRQAERSRDRA